MAIDTQYNDLTLRNRNKTNFKINYYYNIKYSFYTFLVSYKSNNIIV